TTFLCRYALWLTTNDSSSHFRRSAACKLQHKSSSIRHQLPEMPWSMALRVGQSRLSNLLLTHPLNRKFPGLSIAVYRMPGYLFRLSHRLTYELSTNSTKEPDNW